MRTHVPSNRPIGESLELQHWSYATSVRDEPFVLREIKKVGMSKHAVGKLEEAMWRVEVGLAKPHETSKVRGDVLELRVNQDKRWYRLLFARVNDDYVALLLGAKKTNRLDDGWITTALQRLEDHRA